MRPDLYITAKPPLEPPELAFLRCCEASFSAHQELGQIGPAPFCKRSAATVKLSERCSAISKRLSGCRICRPVGPRISPWRKLPPSRSQEAKPSEASCSLWSPSSWGFAAREEKGTWDTKKPLLWLPCCRAVLRTSMNIPDVTSKVHFTRCLLNRRSSCVLQEHSLLLRSCPLKFLRPFG